MFPDTFRKRRQRDILDAQIFVKRSTVGLNFVSLLGSYSDIENRCRDVNFVCIILVIFFILILFGSLAYLKVFFSAGPTGAERDTSRQSWLQGTQDIEDLRIIHEDQENMCVAWRDIDGCLLSGARRPRKDRNCSSVIAPAQTGWCECKEESGVHFQIEFECSVNGRPERTESFTCAKECKSRILDGRQKSLKLSRAFEASTKHAETLAERERRRHEEAERKRREEEEREEALRPIRAMIQRGDDLIAEVRCLLNLILCFHPVAVPTLMRRRAGHHQDGCPPPRRGRPASRASPRRLRGRRRRRHRPR